MYYRVFRYFTRPSLIAANRERKEAGMPRRHALPNFKELPKKGKFVVTLSYPYPNGLGDKIPHVRCFILWPEGGMAWTQDVTVDRWRKLPTLTEENPHAYRFESEGE